MCIYEIWVYRECGCSYDHYVPCCELLEQQQSSATKSAHSPTLMLTTSTQIQLSDQLFQAYPQESDSVGIVTSTDGFCSNFGHPNIDPCNASAAKTTHKEFLEPICDDCLLKELNDEVSINSASSFNSSDAQIILENPILESTVTIEVERSSTDVTSELERSEMTRTAIGTLYSKIYIDTESREFKFPTRTRDSSPSIAHNRISHRRLFRSSVDNSTTNNDADDEGSLNLRPSLASTFSSPYNSPPRGRARSCTREVRREGIEISRDEVQIPSCHSSGENRSMERFRSALRDMTSEKGKEDDVLKRWAIADNLSWSKAKTVKKKVKELGSNITRSRSMKKDYPDIVEPDETKIEELRRLASRQQNILNDYYASCGMPMPALRMVETEDENSVLKSQQTAPTNAVNYSTNFDIENVDEDINQSSTVDESCQPTWAEHLQQDLSSRQKRGRGVRLAKSAGNLLERPFKDKFKSMTQMKNHKTHTHSKESISISSHVEENSRSCNTAMESSIQLLKDHRYVYSPRSSSVSLPPISLSMGTTAAWPLIEEDGERLGDVMGLDEFDEDSDDDAFPQWRRIGSLTSNSSKKPITKSTSMYNLRHEPLELPDTIRSGGSMESLVNAIHRLQLQGADSYLTNETKPSTSDPCSNTPNSQEEDLDQDMIDIFPDPPHRGSHSLDNRASSISWPGSNSIIMPDYVPTTGDSSTNFSDSRLSIHPLTTEFIQGLSFKKKRKTEMHEKNWEVEELYTRRNPWVEY